MNESNPTPRFALTDPALSAADGLKAHKRSTTKLRSVNCARFSSESHKRLMDCFCCVSLWLSFPLIVWLSSGWIGLLAHCQAMAGVALLFEKAKSSPALRSILAGNELSEGELQCCLVKNEAR